LENLHVVDLCLEHQELYDKKGREQHGNLIEGCDHLQIDRDIRDQGYEIRHRPDACDSDGQMENGNQLGICTHCGTGETEEKECGNHTHKETHLRWYDLQQEILGNLREIDARTDNQYRISHHQDGL